MSLPCELTKRRLPGKPQRLSQEANTKLKAEGTGPEVGVREASWGQLSGGQWVARSREEETGRKGGRAATREASGLTSDIGHGALGVTETAKLTQSLWVSAVARE